MPLSKLRKVLKIALLTYVVGLAFVALHFPATIMQAVRGGAPLVLAAPAMSVGIVRVYGQFAVAATWPYGRRRNVVLLDDLIASHGVRPFSNAPFREVGFNFTPEVRPGQEGRRVYGLNPESYSEAFYGAFASVQGGGLLQIGRYFCMMNNDGAFMSRMIGSSDCYEVLHRSNGRYYWRRLGSDKEHLVLLET